jgi:hypothetical protein
MYSNITLIPVIGGKVRRAQNTQLRFFDARKTFVGTLHVEPIDQEVCNQLWPQRPISKK